MPIEKNTRPAGLGMLEGRCLYVYSEVFDLKPTSGRRELKHSSTQEVKNGGCKVFDLEMTGGYTRVHEPGS